MALRPGRRKDVYRDVGEVGGRERPLLAICRIGEIADDLDHDGTPSLR